ncbi:hypothetical protein PoB_004018900 [Plakobranchus ocellatus]|uniref:Uncharacterized protein n=1 Tax=Plakobranchus ocellatus TaxID=259542 RepID=A0AAV4B0Z5_9GAST|nr:hypothetical protein PoB_004018900 [Plakobranchus ocellatus]
MREQGSRETSEKKRSLTSDTVKGPGYTKVMTQGSWLKIRSCHTHPVSSSSGFHASGASTTMILMWMLVPLPSVGQADLLRHNSFVGYVRTGLRGGS